MSHCGIRWNNQLEYILMKMCFIKSILLVRINHDFILVTKNHNTKFRLWLYTYTRMNDLTWFVLWKLQTNLPWRWNVILDSYENLKLMKPFCAFRCHFYFKVTKRLSHNCTLINCGFISQKQNACPINTS